MKRLLLLALILSVSALPAAAPPRHGDDLPKGATLRIGTTRLRHGGLVRAVAISPDGKWVASASHDRTASVWHVSSGKERFRFSEHTGDVVCLAFAPDGKTLASGAADGSLRLWALTGEKAGASIHRIATRADSIEAVAYSPAGKRLAFGGDDGILHVLNATTRIGIYAKQLERGIRALAWSADGKAIATSGDAKHAIVLWDAETGKKSRSFGEETIQALAFAPKGSDLVSWEDGGVMRLWDTSTGKQTRKWESESAGSLIYQIVYTRGGKSILAGNHAGAVEEWEPATGKLRRTLAGLHAGRVSALALRGELLATGGGDHAVRLHDLTTGKTLTPTTEPAAPITALSSAENGKSLIGLLSTGEVRIWSRDGKAQPAPKVGKALAIAGLPNDSTILIVNAKGQLVSHDLTKKASTVIDDEGPLAALGLSGDGKLPVGVLRNGMVPIYRSAKSRPIARGRERGASPVVSRDGSLVAVVGRAANVAIFETKQGDELAGLAGHGGGTLAAAFSPDGRLLATGGRDRYLRVWEMQTRKQRTKPIPHADWVCAVAFGPDGKLIATGTTAGGIQLIDPASGKVAAELAGHRGRVSGLLFVDRDTLVSSGQDGTLLVWDMAKVGRGGLSAKALKESERLALWKTLGEEDAVSAGLAMRELARDPAETMKSIAARLKPIDGKQVSGWIEDLDAEKFAVRENAMKRLAALGQSVESMLRRRLEKKPSIEQHRRIETLLEKMKGHDGGHVQAVRAVELLEQIGTLAARKVLKELAGGAEDAALTREAKAALERLGK